MSLISNLIEQYTTDCKKKNYWLGSDFEKLLSLSSDARGKWGEELIFRLLTMYTCLKVEWEGDKNTNREDGSIWDIFINFFETEIKTAMKNSSSDMWQHEKIVQAEVWKKTIFVDIEYSGIWFTVQNYGDIPYGEERHKILNKKSTFHLDGWKFDLSKKHILKLQSSGCSFYYDVKNPDVEGFKSFFGYHFTAKSND